MKGKEGLGWKQPGLSLYNILLYDTFRYHVIMVHTGLTTYFVKMYIEKYGRKKGCVLISQIFKNIIIRKTSEELVNLPICSICLQQQQLSVVFGSVL